MLLKTPKCGIEKNDLRKGILAVSLSPNSRDKIQKEIKKKKPTRLVSLKSFVETFINLNL